MSAQRFTSAGGPPPSKEKYIPLRERTQNNTVPLYDQPEAQAYLMTVENMLERSTGTLQDSIWAPHNRVKQPPQPRSSASQARQPVRQPSGPTQLQKPQQPSGPVAVRQQLPRPSVPAEMVSPATQLKESDSAPWGNSTWGMDAQQPSSFGQGQTSWESQPAQIVNSSGETAAPSWAVQPPHTANPEPEGMASLAVMAGQQTSSVASNHFRTAPRQTYVPSHLQGIDPESEQAPIVAPESFAKPETPEQAPSFQATDEEAWARKMGLLREPVKQVPHIQSSVTHEPHLQEQPKAPVVTAKVDTEGEAWARKMGLLPKTPEQTKPLAKGHTDGEEWARKMGLLRESGAAMQVPSILQSPIAKAAQHGQQTPTRVANPAATTQNKASKVARNTPFNNPQFHLKQDSNEHFKQYIQGSTISNGKKYTLSGLVPAANKQQNASSNDTTIQPSGGPNVASQQQRNLLLPKHQKGAPQSPSPNKQSVQNKTENRAPYTKHDPNMMFGPSQIASAGPRVNKAVAQQKTSNSPGVMTGPWPTQQTADVKSFNEKVAHELNETKKVNAKTAPLTQNALVTTTGFMPRDHSHKFDDQISDDGVIEQNAKEGIRATQGKNGADELVDWDGKHWAPAPCDWENERPAFDDSFVPDYVREWRVSLPCGPSIQVDTSLEQFKGGKCPINNDVLIDPIEQPESLPDIGNCENEMKRLHQTALLDANNFRAREERKQRKTEGFKAAYDARHRQIAMAVDDPNPFSPKVEMYVRPAQRKDAQDIRKIYNHYVVNSIIPEDQQPISLEDAELLVETAQREKLPFVVAVKGRVPLTHDAQGQTRSTKVILPQAETVLGFAFAERFNYAFSGNTKGRSRGTVTIQLYVDSTSTRKGVGRNTLDQLLHCMATAYTFKNACPWINPESDPVHEPNGCGLIHQMLMMVPVLKKEDPDFPWLSKFLYNKFWFKEENRLKSVARSSILHGTGRMLDIAILQCELLHEGEFDAFT